MTESTAVAERGVTEADLKSVGFGTTMQMSKGLAVFLNDALFNRCKQLAGALSKAEGTTPRHLLGKPEACFAVIARAITWNLDPYAVMACTYQTPSGSIGYEGKLVQAILENSGQLTGGVKYELFGPWEKVRGKFKWATSSKSDKKYAVPGWDEFVDEEGIGVIVTAQVKGEIEPRSEKFFLNTFWPRNSTLWALRPEQQIKYAAARAFANTAMPGILLGVPFDAEVDSFTSDSSPVDITPARPSLGGADDKNPFNRQAAPAATGGNAETSPPAQQEPENRTQDGGQSPADENQDRGEQEQREETPLERGNRLLKSVNTIPDLAGLRATILEEILDDDEAVASWDKACDARGRELTPNANTGGKKKSGK